jgi:hypothetical protein
MTRRPPNYLSPISGRLPIELYPFILQHITDKTVLRKICTVSRIFRHEVERILYHAVVLPEVYNSILLWCKTVVENPRLAALVYALTLPTTCNREFLESLEDLHATLKRALSSLSSLREVHTYVGRSNLAYISPSIFQGHPFRLRVFDSHLGRPFTLNDWIQFLSEQPGIQHWRPDLDPSINYVLGVDILPLLTSARIHSSLLYVLANRPIRTVQISNLARSSFLDHLAVGLKAFQHTLKNLSLRNVEDYPVGDYEYAPQLFRILSRVVPHLEFLDLESEILVRPLFASSPGTIQVDAVLRNHSYLVESPP